MKGRFQPTTVGNMVRDADGAYVSYEDYEELREENMRLRERDAQWIDFAMAVGKSVGCLASPFPDANGHVLRKMPPCAQADADEIKRLNGAMLTAASLLERDGDEHSVGYALRRAMTSNV